MASHYSSLGFGSDRGAVFAAVDHAFAHAPALESPNGMATHDWVDGSGASIAVVVGPQRTMECAKPYLRDDVVRPVALRARQLQQTDCNFCSVAVAEVLDPDGETLFPMAFEFARESIDVASHESSAIAPWRMTGLAEQVAFFPDEAAFAASGTPMAPRSFIPSGLFHGEGGTPRATGLATGHIIASWPTTNSLTGYAFWRVVIETLGMQLAIAVAADDVDATAPSAPGGICSATVWLVAVPA